MPSARKVYIVLLTLLALVLVGTITVLSTVKSFFGVDWNDVILPHELEQYNASSSTTITTTPVLPYNASASEPWTTTIDGQVYAYERIPRILHQTWKTDNLPERWASFSAQCREMHPDYQYMLWTDANARSFIAEHYPWFLSTYDGYRYPIQRADVIRYFVLHKYGGVYLDLDIGCRRPVDPLLNFPAILPVTKPIGVSNDLMFSEPASPFMDSVIHNLVAFDHQYLSAYPTVMFSTGPMFISAMLAMWTGKEQVRILPTSYYGKNVDPAEVPESFFWHYYGSSWHADDSQIFTFLGQFGKTILHIIALVLLLGTLRLVWSYKATLLAKLWPFPSPKAGPISLPHDHDIPPSRPHSRNASRGDIFVWVPVPHEQLPRYVSDNLSLHSVKIDNN